MVDTLKHLPKGDLIRLAVAKQLTNARSLDQLYGWTNNRDGYWYIVELGGLRSTLEYVKRLQPPVVLDIGTGRGFGINDIAGSPLGEGLVFRATALTFDPAHSTINNRVRITYTAAEILHGFENGSVACVLAVFSIGYCIKPEFVATRIDQILAPGGVVKAVSCTHKRLGCSTPENLSLCFSTLGYDVYLEDKSPINYPRDYQTLLAVKPNPDGKTPSARDLMLSDKQYLGDDISLFLENL